MTAYSTHYPEHTTPMWLNSHEHPPITPDTVWETLGKTMLADGGGITDFVLDLRRSRGSYLYDSLNQRMMLDFFTFVASSPIGINHPKLWSNRAFLDKLLFAAIVNPSNSDIYTVEFAEFVDTFSQVAKPASMKYTFWISGGALAVENALKAAFDWKVRKNFKKGYKSEKGHHVIYFREAFHGRSGYTLSLTNTDPAKTLHFPKFSWSCIENPKLTFPLSERHIQKALDLEKHAIASIQKVFKEHQDEVAAIVIEPIQGEGGDNHFRPEFLKHLQTLAHEHEALLIFDEVQTGLGLTGKMWASEHFIIPDIITFGKKMQVCGFMASNRLDEVDQHVFQAGSRINSTWGGNLADMVRSKRNLEIIKEDNLVLNAATVGNHLLNQLLELGEEFGERLTNIRGRGLMIAFDMPNRDSRNHFIKNAQDSGLMILGCGEKSVRLRPPLTLSLEEADEGISIIRKVVQTMA
ncbi:MAG: L-lysine 6-transaminase [Chloroherpetonaceae bacterium]|nr:L-lysine 6-transaminase [Chloroherpetonaceae bacterium]